MTIQESLTKTVHSLEFASNDMRDALNKANPVEFIIILDLIGTIASTKIKTDNLLSAISAIKNRD